MLSKNQIAERRSKILDAKQKVLDIFPNCEVISCVEYKNLIVFVVEPEMLGLIAVNKDTNIVFGFNPIIEGSDDYFEVAKKNSIIF